MTKVTADLYQDKVEIQFTRALADWYQGKVESKSSMPVVPNLCNGLNP